MAEFIEVMKQKRRMCKMVGNKNNCPLYQHCKSCVGCNNFLAELPTIAEEVVMNWAKENPIVTNRAKFKEMFGFSLPHNAEDFCPKIYEDYVLGIVQETCPDNKCCDNCFYNFWDMEFVEPKKESK